MSPFLPDNLQADDINHENNVIIPVWHLKGFKTVSVQSKILQNIQNHHLKNVSVNTGKILGILRGRENNGEEIEIQESLELSHDADADSIIKNINSYNSSNSQLLGFYSNGKIPDEKDVSIIQALSRFLGLSLFLIKFDCSEDVNMVEVFEGVFRSYSENDELVFYPTTNNPFEQFKTDECTNFNTPENLIKFLFPQAERQRMVHDLNPELTKSRIETLKKLLNDSWEVEKKKNYVSYLKAICDKAGMESVYLFHIPLNGEEQRIISVLYLTCDFKNSYCTQSLTIEGAQEKMAYIFIVLPAT